MKLKEEKSGQLEHAESPKNNPINPSSEFVSSAISMSWKLAIIVLVPIIGGYKLDVHFKTQPLLTVIGFVVAMIGTTLVIRQQMNYLNNKIKNAGKKQ